MANQTKTICIRDVQFQKINEQVFNSLKLSDILLILVSSSGMIDKPGRVYIFMPKSAFFMDKYCYGNNFIGELLSRIEQQNWGIQNVYLCDNVCVNPKIYIPFMRAVCARNIRDYWFQTAIDVYRDKKWKKY